MGYDEKKNIWTGDIYCITNKIDGKKYIGQTQQGVIVRWYKHKSTEHIFSFQKALKKYGPDNFELSILEHVENDNKRELREQLFEREIYWISYFDTTNPNKGYNQTRGGRNSPLDNMRPIYQFSLDGVFIKGFDSMAEAAREMTGTDNTNNLYICAQHKTGQAYGYVWEFEPQCSRIYRGKPAQDKSWSYKKVISYNKHGDVIKEYESVIAASLELFGKKTGTISNVCTGRRPTIHQLVFRYEGEPFDKYPIMNDMIASYDNSGNLIAIFEDAPTAAKYLGISLAKVKNDLRKPIRSALYHFKRIKCVEDYHQVILKNEVN